MPRVTVVMATYNWATVLPYSIASILDQTFTDFELLVIGDGCTGDSAEVVAGFDDPRVQWHNLPSNAGHQYAALFVTGERIIDLRVIFQPFVQPRKDRVVVGADGLRHGIACAQDAGDRRVGHLFLLGIGRDPAGHGKAEVFLQHNFSGLQGSFRPGLNG